MKHWEINRPRRKSWFDVECRIILKGEKRAFNKMMDRNTRQSEQDHKDKRKEAHKIFRQRERERGGGLFKSKLEPMEIVYNNNEAEEFYKEVKSIKKKKGFSPQTLLIIDKEGN